MRRLTWKDCFNVRDLGGFPNQNGAQTRWRAIVRADSLCRLAPEGQTALIAYGVRTILDLRAESELEEQPNPFARNFPGSPAYLNLPLVDFEDQDWRAASREAENTAEGYILILEHFHDRIAAIIRAIANAEPGTILFHCFAGKDRTGIIAALLLTLAGVPAEVIEADYAESDRNLQPLYAQILEKETRSVAEREHLAMKLVSPPGTMLSVLAYLDEQYGGVVAYLQAGGVTPEELEQIRERLLGPPEH